MNVLGSWGVINLGTGIAGWAASNDGSHKYFYQMNTLWGATNAAIATLSLTNARKNIGRQLNSDETLKAQQSIEKIFLINGGLDFVYIGSGIFLNSRGNSRNNEKLKGYGTSVIMQGAFLLLFDAAMYNAHRTNGNKLRNFLAGTSVTFTGNGIVVMHNK
jgi:hypothetical protein